MKMPVDDYETSTVFEGNKTIDTLIRLSLTPPESCENSFWLVDNFKFRIDLFTFG